MRGFRELLVDEPVFPGQRLDIFSQLSDLLLLQLCQLLLTFSLFHVPLAFRPELLNLSFTFIQFPVQLIFFAICNTHLVLHITELEALLL